MQELQVSACQCGVVAESGLVIRLLLMTDSGTNRVGVWPGRERFGRVVSAQPV